MFVQMHTSPFLLYLFAKGDEFEGGAGSTSVEQQNNAYRQADDWKPITEARIECALLFVYGYVRNQEILVGIGTNLLGYYVAMRVNYT